MWNLKAQWKTSLKFGQGSKVHAKPIFHNARGWVYVSGLSLDREDAVFKGWMLSRSKNRPLIWKDRLGRMEWFETDRVNLYIKAPALKGRVFQLFCNGFSMTGLISSISVLERLLDSIRLKAAHATFECGERLPYLVVDLFKMSNGIVIRAGDLSHPTRLEVEFCYPAWAERNERLLATIARAMYPELGKPEETTGKTRQNFYG